MMGDAHLETGCVRVAASKEAAHAAGVLVYLTEELGDARLNCTRLKAYIDEARQIVEASEQREHIFEVAAHLLHAIPETLARLEKALQASAMAAARMDYEEIKNALRPEEADELERVLEDVRIQYPQHRSGEAMNAKIAADTLDQIAQTAETTGVLPIAEVQTLLATLESGSKVASAKPTKTAARLRGIAAGMRKGMDEGKRVSRFRLAYALRRILADAILEPITPPTTAGAGEQFQKANPAITDEEVAKINEEHEKNKDNLKA